MTTQTIKRGDIWEVQFNPTEGDEIQKLRPAIVMSVAGAGRMNLKIVAPITSWQSHFQAYFWMVNLKPSATNGLKNESAADAVQVRSVSLKRFQRKLGELGQDKLQEIAAAITLCIGYKDK